MPGTPTTRLGLPTMAGTTDVASTIDNTYNAAQAILDGAAIWKSGVFASRPAATAVAAGTFYRPTDVAGVAYLSDGATWLTITQPVEGWTSATLLNSWLDNGLPWSTPGYYKDPFGCVHLRGMVQAGGSTTNVTIFELPTGYRPPATVEFGCISQSGPGNVARVQVVNDGTVLQVGTSRSTLSLDVVSFRTS